MNKNPALPKNIKRKSSNIEGEDFILFDVGAEEFKTNTSLISPIIGVSLRDTKFFSKDTVLVNGSSGAALLVEAHWLDIIAIRDRFAALLLRAAEESDSVNEIERSFLLAWPVLNASSPQALLIIGNGFMGTGFSRAELLDIFQNDKIKIIDKVIYDSIELPVVFCRESKQELFGDLSLDIEEPKGHKLWAAMESNTLEVNCILKSKIQLEEKLNGSHNASGIQNKI